MNTQDEAQQGSGVPRQKATPRFCIEKLEERIAPTHRAGHYPPGQGGYYDPPPKWDWCYGGHKGGSHICKP